MDTIFRCATLADISPIMSLISAAQANLRTAGINQWQNGYPNVNGITRDIENKNSHLLEASGEIVATAALYFGPEPDYHKIYDGAWLSEGPYATIHRITVKQNSSRGFSAQLCKSLQQLCIKANTLSLRADTHSDNIAMRKFLLKQGFTHCGIIYLTGSGEDGAARVAYEKVLTQR